MKGAAAMLRWNGVEKRYGSVRALRGLTLDVERGEVFGFLGPNGAGKSTAIRIATGLARPDGGEVLLAGRPPSDPESRRTLGYLPEDLRFPRRFRLGDWLDVQMRLRDADRGRIGPAAERLGLSDRLGSELAGFSKGMRRRAGLLLLVALDPAIWLLDEPTADLDVAGREIVENVILHGRARGATFFVSSHILSEVERVCDRVGIVEDGRIRETAAPADLLPAPHLVDLVFAELPETWEPLLEDRRYRENRESRRLRVFVDQREEGDRLIALLESKGFPPVQSLFRPATLRDALQGGSGS